MTDSPNKITTFLSEYQKNKELVTLISSINNKAYSDLKDNYKLLLENCRWLVQFYYIAHSNRDFTLEQLTLPLKGITQLSVAASLRLFSKPNHKDRYSYLLFYLRQHSDIFAQIIYFSLLTCSNPTISYEDLKFLTQDDLVYFCFTTFPAIYNFFLTIDDQMAGVSLINNIFSLHFSLHGMNFGKPHKFLSYFVTSLFLSTNPGTFFEMSVYPLIHKYSTTLEDIRFKYKKVGQNLVRELYWIKIVDFTSLLIENLIKNAPLMPAAARFLITQILKFETGTFPFAELFVIDAMICDYLENRLLTAKTVIMHDVCNVLRCGYPQTIIPSPVATTLNLLNLDFNSKVDLKKLITSLRIEKVENDQLTPSIRTMEEMSLFSPRDLSLLHTMVTFFLKFAKIEKVTDLDSSFRGLAPPNSDTDDSVICLKCWSTSLSSNRFSSKLFDSGRDFDEIIDCTTCIDIKKLHFTTASDLSEKALVFCGSGLNSLQRLRINNVKPDFENELDAAIDSIKKSKETISQYSDVLSASLFAITAENHRNSAMIKRALVLFLRVKFVPLLNELFSTPDSIIINNNFNVPAGDGGSLIAPAVGMVNIDGLPPIKREMARNSILIGVIEKLASNFGLPRNQNALMKKEYAMIYVDKRDATQKFQIEYKGQYEDQFISFIQKVFEVFHCKSLESSRLNDEIIEELNLVDVKAPPSANCRTIVKIMRLMSKLSHEEKLMAIAKSGNVGVFAFAEFIKNHINEKLEDIIFTKNEKYYIHQFLTIIDRIKLMK